MDGGELRALDLRGKLLVTYGLLVLVSMGLSAGYFLYDSDRFYLRQATADLERPASSKPALHGQRGVA
jgi:uncharacterized membrane-anchored protein